jgi:hypothetical protein
MKNVNQLVFDVQAEGNDSYSYVELFDVIATQTIEPKAESFRKQLKGQVEEAISIGYDLLMELVPAWDGTGNFHTLFKTSYTNRLINHVKYVAREKRSHNTNYDVSLSENAASEMNTGEASPLIETINDDSLTSTFDITEDGVNKVEALLELFAIKYPEQAEVLDIMTLFSDDTKQSEKTTAYTEHYCTQTYTQAIQKRVSRSRENFKKFLIKNGYSLNF